MPGSGFRHADGESGDVRRDAVDGRGGDVAHARAQLLQHGSGGVDGFGHIGEAAGEVAAHEADTQALQRPRIARLRQIGGEVRGRDTGSAGSSGV